MAYFFDFQGIGIGLAKVRLMFNLNFKSHVNSQI